jgi:hypothetical protein
VCCVLWAQVCVGVKWAHVCAWFAWMSALVQIPDSRYVELRAMDVIKFGTSTREYVLLHDQL